METRLESVFSYCVFCYKTTNVSNKAEHLKRCFTLICRQLNFGNNNYKDRDNILKELASLFSGDDFGTTRNPTLVVCEECLIIVEEFRDLYHQMKCLKLRINWQIDKLCNIMRYADKVPYRVKEFKESKKNGNPGAADKLIAFRQKFKRCCKIYNAQTSPRVMLSSLPPISSFLSQKVVQEEDDDFDTLSGQHVSETENNDDIEFDEMSSLQEIEQARPLNPDRPSSSQEEKLKLSSGSHGSGTCKITPTSSHHLEAIWRRRYMNIPEHEEEIRAKFLIVSQKVFPKSLPKLTKETEQDKAATNSLKKLWRCNLCKARFSSNYWLQVHQEHEHSRSSTNSISAIIQQQRKGNNKKETNLILKKWKCNLCTFLCTSKNSLKHHKHFKHANDVKLALAHFCSICSKMFATHQSLYQHTVFYHTEKRFMSSKLQHLSTDEFKKYVSCLVNTTVKSLKRSKSTNNNKYGPLKYECKFCPKQLSNMRSASAHLVSIHRKNLKEKLVTLQKTVSLEDLPDVSDKTASRKYTCTLCGKRLKEDYLSHEHEVTTHPEILFRSSKSPHLSNDQFRAYFTHLLKQESSACTQKEGGNSNKRSQLICPYCSKHVSSESNAKYHLVLKHGEILTKKVIELQSTLKPDQVELVEISRHRKQARQGSREECFQIECRVCFKGFHDVQHKKQHEANEHPEIFYLSLKSADITADQFRLYVWNVVHEEVKKFKEVTAKIIGKVKFECPHCSNLLCNMTYARTHVTLRHHEILGKKVRELQTTTKPVDLPAVKFHRNRRKRINRCRVMYSDSDDSIDYDSDQSTLSRVTTTQRPADSDEQLEYTDEFITGGCDVVETKFGLDLANINVVSKDATISPLCVQLKREQYEASEMILPD